MYFKKIFRCILVLSIYKFIRIMGFIIVSGRIVRNGVVGRDGIALGVF